MKRRRTEDSEADLFAAAAQAPAQPEDGAPLIASPLVEETAVLLEKRTLALGNLLASERCVEYVAILRAFVDFRMRHEPEPLHEAIEDAVCGEDAAPSARTQFKADLRQLEDWRIVAKRIEKERLRGYRDVRRTKFRYRICDDAAAFVDWLRERRDADLNPSGGDETGNLLDIQRSLLAEMRRMLRKVDAADCEPDLAGDIIYRVDRMSRNVDATAKALQTLNLRLLSFGMEDFSVDEAKPIVAELGVFLERFGRRFAVMREDIIRDIAELRRTANAPRWQACIVKFRAETEKIRHIASVRIPDVDAALADAERFYTAGGSLVALMTRVGSSARKVWGKLNARLRELERRNHRIEDIEARLAEFASHDDAFVPHAWLRRLFECAAMRGDAQIRPGGEKSLPPKPRTSTRTESAKRTPSWITPRKVGDHADVKSISQTRAEELKNWMLLRGLANRNGVKISDGNYAEFADFPNIMRLIEAIRLGNGDKARRHLGITATPTGQTASISIAPSSISFEDLQMNEE